jgi:predicted amidohydrolase
MAFLPEGFDYIAETKEQSLSMAESLDGDTISAYRQIARDNGIALSLGGFHCKSDVEGKTKNTHIIIDEHGVLTATYEKCHLFDVNIPEKGIKLRSVQLINSLMNQLC